MQTLTVKRATLYVKMGSSLSHYSLSFWLQMNEPITHVHMDTDNYITIHCNLKEQVTLIPLPTWCVLFTRLKEMMNYHSL